MCCSWILYWSMDIRVRYPSTVIRVNGYLCQRLSVSTSTVIRVHGWVIWQLLTALKWEGVTVQGLTFGTGDAVFHVPAGAEICIKISAVSFANSAILSTVH